MPGARARGKTAPMEHSRLRRTVKELRQVAPICVLAVALGALQITEPIAQPSNGVPDQPRTGVATSSKRVTNTMASESSKRMLTLTSLGFPNRETGAGAARGRLR